KFPATICVRRIQRSDPLRSLNTTHIGVEVERIRGYRPAEFILDPDLWAARIHPDDLGRVFGTWRDTSEVGSRYHLAYRMVTRDGRLVHVHDSASVEEEPGSGIRFWYGVVVDVTADRETGPTLREAEAKYRLLVEQIPAVTYIDEVPEDGAPKFWQGIYIDITDLKRAEELKNTFLQAVSHDLRTPLAAILGLAVTLAQESIDLTDDDVRDLANRIAGNARKLDRIVADL